MKNVSRSKNTSKKVSKLPLVVLLLVVVAVLYMFGSSMSSGKKNNVLSDDQTASASENDTASEGENTADTGSAAGDESSAEAEPGSEPLTFSFDPPADAETAAQGDSKDDTEKTGDNQPGTQPASAEKEFKVPLTIINADTEIMERESGETDQTLSINRQVKKMLGLVKNLSSMAVFEEKELTKLQCDLCALSQEIGDAMKDRFAGRNRILEVTSDPAVIIQGDSEAMSQLISELLENALKFSVSRARLKAGREKGRSEIIAINDTTLPDGNYDQVFDRFTRLENAGDLPGAGLGLSHVKEIVQAHNGRAYARVMNGEFILRISL